MKRGSRSLRPFKSRGKPNTIEARQRFCIVCEGERTEPNYFKGIKRYLDGFSKRKVKIDVYGLGKDPVNLITETIRLRDHKSNLYDQFWCVFDKDDIDNNVFDSALGMAKTNGIRVAYSNECFELWFLLHFDSCLTPLNRVELKRRLTRHLGRTYTKGDRDMFESLNKSTSVAVIRAQRLLDSYSTGSVAQQNPSTTVHVLVEQLLQSKVT